MSAVLALALSRARRRPGRFAFVSLGLAVAIAFAGVVLAEGTIAGDQAARRVLNDASPLARSVRVDWTGPANQTVTARAEKTLSGLGFPPQAHVVLMSPIRLDGVVVRLAAIAPLDRFSAHEGPLGPCRPSGCPMLLAGGRLAHGTLTAPGVRISVAGSTRLLSAAPLGFLPGHGQTPLLLTGDLTGLNTLPALASLYRTSSWLSVAAPDRLQSWDLASLETRLQRAQVGLTGTSSGFNFTAPFDVIDAARSRAHAAPRGLLLAGGGALAALAMFVVLAGAALRTEMRAELARLRAAGGRASECAALALLEAGWISALAVLAGAGTALGVAAVLAAAGGVPVGAAINHSLLAGPSAAGAVGAWIGATILVAALVGLPRRGLVAVADALAIAGLAALIVALALGASSHATALLIAPVACLTAGLLLVRGMGFALRAGERLARRSSPLARVAALGLARGPGLPSVAVAFIAISVGLGGFALSYRATLLRSAADQASDRVPLDARVEAGASFVPPLGLAPLARWRALAGGSVLPVRRTQANYPYGGQTVTEPALGVPAPGLTLMHGWRTSDASQPLSALARRLVPPGPVRRPGPAVPPQARRLAVSAWAPLGAEVSADLRAPDGSVDQVPLGEAERTRRTLSATIPGGRWELEALELAVPAGAEATNGHQNAENPAAPPTGSTPVELGEPVALDGRGRRLARLEMGGWRGVGAAVDAGRREPGGVTVQFAESGALGVLRPPEPSDRHPLPVLADRRTAAGSGPGRTLTLTLDGLPVRARVVGVLARFPTLPSDASGFVVADEAALAATLDAVAPGQGRPDELWLASGHLGRLRAALSRGRLAQLQSSFRTDIARSLRDDPVARAVLGTLIAAALVALALALAGLQAIGVGAARDARLEADLAGLGIGPRGLRAELRLRLATAALTGVIAGAAVGVLIAGLAVAGVGSALGAARPSVVAVIPVWAVVLWIAVALLMLGVSGWAGTLSARRTA